MKSCKHCRYAEWHRTPSGRLSPTGDGRCTFEIRLPALPVAFYWLGHAVNNRPGIGGGAINRHGELKRDCPTFAWADTVKRGAEANA